MKRPALLFLLLFSGPLAAQSSLFQPSGANFYVLRKGTKQFILRQSRLTGGGLHKKFGQIASGERITSAGVDAAGLAVAQQMDALIRGLRRESMNAGDYRSYLRHVEGMVAQDHKLVQRIRELVLASNHGLLQPEDREIQQTEIDQLLDQIDMNARFAQFNKQAIIPELTAEKLELRKIDVVRDPHGSLKYAEAALKKLMRRRVVAGIKDNALVFKIKGQSYYLVNQIQSMSRISDQDMAEAMTSFHRDNVMMKTQTGVLMMARD